MSPRFIWIIQISFDQNCTFYRLSIRIPKIEMSKPVRKNHYSVNLTFKFLKYKITSGFRKIQEVKRFVFFSIGILCPFQSRRSFDIVYILKAFSFAVRQVIESWKSRQVYKVSTIIRVHVKFILAQFELYYFQLMPRIPIKINLFFTWVCIKCPKDNLYFQINSKSDNRY